MFPITNNKYIAFFTFEKKMPLGLRMIISHFIESLCPQRRQVFQNFTSNSFLHYYKPSYFFSIIHLKKDYAFWLLSKQHVPMLQQIDGIFSTFQIKVCPFCV